MLFEKYQDNLGYLKFWLVKKHVYLLISFIVHFTNAQSFAIDDYNGQTINTCNGTFYDSGLANANYGNGENYSVTFCSDTPGEILRIEFSNFNTENNFDYLNAYYGNSIAGVRDFLFTNVMSNFSVSEQNSGECISFRFRSDSSVTRSGWIGEISCVAPCNLPIAVIADDSVVNVCQDDMEGHTITVDGSNSYSTDEYTIVNYIWSWGDGTTTTTTSTTASHTYPDNPAIYNIQLSVSTDNTTLNPEGCVSSNAAFKQINVLPPPIFDGTSASSQTINCGESLELEGVVSSQTIISQPPVGLGSDTALPDTTQVPFESTINFTDYFPPGATLSATCLPEITLNLEHSYAGDLEILLIAPSGEQVILFDGYSTSTINNDFFGYCANGSDGTGPGCHAPYYIVDNGGIEWTDAAAITNVSNACDDYNGPCQFGDYFVQDETYNSYESLTNLIGAQLNGIWTIRIIDNLSLDDGYLESWSMNFPAQCYNNLDIVTPLLANLTWSTDGTGPEVPTPQGFTNEIYETVGIDPCPIGEVCEGNQLSNNITIGPFLQTGDYVYNLTAIDEFGCTFTEDITITVEQGEAEFDGLLATYCLNDTDVPELPTTSDNGIEGSWEPVTIDTGTLGVSTYTFTPGDLSCAPIFDFDVTIEDVPSTSQIVYD